MDNPESQMSIQSGYVLVERPQDFKVSWSEQPAELARISALCKKAGCRNVLVRGPRTRVRLSEMDIFRLGEAISKLGLMIAVVEIHDASKQDVQFLTNVVTNRGRPIQFFDNEQDAKVWLGVE